MEISTIYVLNIKNEETLASIEKHYVWSPYRKMRMPT